MHLVQSNRWSKLLFAVVVASTLFFVTQGMMSGGELIPPVSSEEIAASITDLEYGKISLSAGASVLNPLGATDVQTSASSL